MQPSNSDRPGSTEPEGESRPEMNLIPVGQPPGGSAGLEARPSAVASSLHLGGLLKGLRRRWLLASSLGLLCAALATAGAWCFLPPGKYTARALLHVDSVPKYMVFPNGQSQTTFQIYQRTQIALVKSRLVLTAALRQPEVSKLRMIGEFEHKGGLEEATDWLERQLQVDFSIGPEILRIALSGDRPEELRILVSAVENAYLKEIVQKDKLTRNIHLDQLRTISGRLEGDVKSKRDYIAKISKPLGTTDALALATILKFREDYLNKTEIELLDVRSQLRKLEVQATGVPSNSATLEVSISDRTIDEYLRNDPQGKVLLTRKLELEAQIQGAQSVLGNTSPIIQRYKSDLEAAEAALGGLRKEVRPRLVKDFLEKDRINKQTNQGMLQQQIALLKIYEKRLNNDVQKLQKEITNIGQSTLDIESEKAELLKREETSKHVAHEVEALEVEQNAPERITHLEDAYVTHANELKRKLVACGMSGGGGLALVLFLVGWLEFRRQRVNSVEEVVEGLGMKLVGTVPALPNRRQLRHLGANGSADTRWQNILTESVDTARTMLLHMARSESLRIVMVTSAKGGEGKTSLSSHLAASLARAGRKTLLLDADLRSPAIHRLFGVERAPGLCEILRGEAELADTIQPTPAGGLWLIPSGQCDAQALQALAQDNFHRVCAQLRAEYDFVIVDSAPVLPVADSLLVGQSVDAVIFSILHDVSRLPKVYAAHQRLEMLGIRMLGAVVSGTQVDSYEPDYPYESRIES